MFKGFTLLLLVVFTLAAASFAVTCTGNIQLQDQLPDGSWAGFYNTSLDSSGSYSVPSAAISGLGVGTYQVRAQYSGDDTCPANISLATTDTIASSSGGDTVTITISPNPATPGTVQTFSGSVTPTPGASPASKKP